jgi:hypothetical protein
MARDWLTLRRGRRSAFGVLTEFGIMSPPVPIFELAAWMGVPVLRVSEPGWSGALHVVEDPPRVQVWLRAEDSLVRQRFTLAHELGHLLLRHPGPVFRDANFVGNLEEQAANGYAAKLLMPEPWVQEYLDRTNWDLAQVASLFQVSPEAMRIRADRILGMATPY